MAERPRAIGEEARPGRRGRPTSYEAAGLRVQGVRPILTPDTRPVEAVTADGRVWRRLWSLVDRLVIDFPGIATVEVCSDGGTAFSRLLEPGLELHLVLDHVLPLELARRGELVLHGTVLALGERGVVVLGRSGAGKSTLAAYFWQRGWTVGGDDGALIDLGPPVTAQPTHPTIRLLPDAVDLLGIRRPRGPQVSGKRRLDAVDHPLRERATPLVAVMLLEPIGPGEPTRVIRQRGAAALAGMFAATFHTDLADPDVTGRAARKLALLAEEVSVSRLRVARGLRGLAQAEAALREALRL